VVTHTYILPADLSRESSCICYLLHPPSPFLANVNSLSRSLYVTSVRPTQAIEIFGNVSTPFGTLAISDLSVKILRRSFQGNPSIKRLNVSGVAKCSDFGPFKAISRKRCKIGGKLVLITSRKMHMSFRLVPKSVTLNDLERRNGHYIALFH